MTDIEKLRIALTYAVEVINEYEDLIMGERCNTVESLTELALKAEKEKSNEHCRP
jgi:hypothetical protein